MQKVIPSASGPCYGTPTRPRRSSSCCEATGRSFGEERAAVEAGDAAVLLTRTCVVHAFVADLCEELGLLSACERHDNDMSFTQTRARC